MQFTCAYCGKIADKSAGAVNRARNAGMNLYCNRVCSGLGRRRAPKSVEQRKAEKRDYDAARRVALAAEIKAEKAAYHKRTYDPAKQREYNQRRMPHHVEYCRRPEYREWKREYDRRYRANKEYGEFADCFLLVMDIRAECLSQMTDYEIRYAKGGVAKTQQRRRDYEQLNREEPEIGALGDFERGEGWKDGCLSGGLRRLPSPRNPAHHEHPVAGRSPVETPGGRGRDRLR